MKIVVASGNKAKLREIAQIFQGYEIVSMQEAGFTDDIEENGSTFEENALIKARAVSRALGVNALADDSGICVEALGGAPGVHSARFCGRHGDDAANNALLLEKLKDVPQDRHRAYFESCVALCFADGREITASGRTYGRILEKAEGEGGFGYDPLFYSDELGMSFGLASAEEKNAVSHRGKALAALAEKLKGMKL
ncbi:MAG TPA: RdgB/HAM1 family non-canonical purine NTP pyrophosphatase [Candidatus Borkfalkia faecipullorum]|uniref:dITP/XTP pyrophosphatase n=1 Tax=Candidatus Borkfalkia faecipullorum TaxID=2838510 RepID=A0A9D1V9R5_9FIRM|nr:RdgB/HAM1 family non-canonical purine NTP pyrophosphatase [Candidatus Borkfalkia faecipullorum]